jgi:hypothetical protein
LLVLLNTVAVLRGSTDSTNALNAFERRQFLIKQLKTPKGVHLLFGTHQNTSFNPGMLLLMLPRVNSGAYLNISKITGVEAENELAKTGVINYYDLSPFLRAISSFG